MSPVPGRLNLAGSAATSAARWSLGKPKPITVSSREKARNTIRPTRNFTRSRTSASYARGSCSASALTSSMVTGTETATGAPVGRANAACRDGNPRH